MLFPVPSVLLTGSKVRIAVKGMTKSQAVKAACFGASGKGGKKGGKGGMKGGY